MAWQMSKNRFSWKRFGWMTLVSLSLAAAWTGLASAQEPTPSDDQVNAIAHQLFCPICENTPLDVCPTQACHQWRELIRQMLAQGKQAVDIRQYFVDNYGMRVLSEPPLEGIFWLVYLIPLVIFLTGAYLLLRTLRGWHRLAQKQTTTADRQAESAADEEYIVRLEEELHKRQ